MASTPLSARVTVTSTPIEQCRVDLVVCSTDLTFSTFTRVSAAIHQAAGPELAEACRAFLGMRPGEVRLTAGFRLHARHVAHVVAPDWVDGDMGEDADLARGVHGALEAATAVGARSIALPPFAGARGGYPVRRSALVVLATVRDFLDAHDGITEVQLSCVDSGVAWTYTSLIKVMFAARGAEAQP